MDLQNSNGSSGADKQKPGLIDLGTFYVDADIIFGFTSHLLKRKAKVSIAAFRTTLTVKCLFLKKHLL